MERAGAWSARLVELMCCMDERDKVQKKTFTKWMNQHLKKVRKHVNDLYEDLRDGHNLISLLEVLSGDTLRKAGKNARRPAWMSKELLDTLSHKKKLYKEWKKGQLEWGAYKEAA
ncbi:spectrin beta chain, non-erythrocytic 2-like [Dryobates pubescens]|uniref:spectrin beta chain, non-erythrocytic 2-like n=1 Tax=Dryobates pubescens TaxID=118200 RepID=UPI0023B8A99B|nr:spectrin beta chain, non-erythrocytic 2-like [Dryobates pubescens]XP_054035912.1 spectrin beta chain, non-erythrocytic 2-like [Dryobates pubescens]